MKRLSENIDSNNMQTKKINGHGSKGELVVKGVATAVAASIIIQTGQGVLSTLAKRPLVMFGLGVVTGYFTHKYRKEIIALTSETAGQSKDFVLRQKQSLKDLIAQSHENKAEEEEASG